MKGRYEVKNRDWLPMRGNRHSDLGRARKDRASAYGRTGQGGAEWFIYDRQEKREVK